MISEPTAVRVSGISKRYGAVHALKNVTAEFQPGEVHAVLGENGAGKSTLMGVLAGFTLPDQGSVALDSGVTLPLGDPSSIRRKGVSMVHQHFMLVPEFTVEENLALAQLPSLKGFSRVTERASKALAIAQDLGWSCDPRARVRDLPVGVQQRLEILKALADDARVLIFDEPTAVLSAEEVADLFRVLDRLRSEGRTILLIAHKLAEVLAIADRVTVLRLGQVVATAAFGSDLSRDEKGSKQLAQWMVGESATAVEINFQGLAEGDPIVKVDRLAVLGDRGEQAVRDVTFDIRPGEIFGFGGVDGNGQVELAEALAGIRRAQSGIVEVPLATYVPQDRQVDGLAMEMSIRENLFITAHRRPEFNRGPFLRKSALRDWAESIRERFLIKAGSLSDPVSSLSGGNQQKVVVGRSLDETPSFLIVINPTRGLDFKATLFVQSEIRRAAEEGSAVALFSTDRDELEALSKKTAFLSRGSLHQTLESSLVGSA